MNPFKIPFSGRAHVYTPTEVETVVEAMQTAQPLTQAKYRNRFEKSFVDFQGGVGQAFAVGCATDALELTAQLCQFSPGDEFIIPAHTYTASCYPFIKKGGSPVWADIDLQSRVVTADMIEKCLTSHTKVIVVVHLYGYVVEMDPILELAKAKDLLVVEDSAQAIGTKYRNQPAGTMGDFGIFPFTPQNYQHFGRRGHAVGS